MAGSNVNIRLRTAITANDIERVRNITASSGYFRNDEVDVAAELATESFQKGSKSGYWFVFADIGDLAVAYCCFGPIPCTIGSYDLYWIAVDADYKRMGIGKLLLAKAEEMAAAMGARTLYIETSARSKYDDTRAFYENNGYRLASILEDFYSPGDHKVTYARKIGITATL